jgi:hypothetical protein
VAGRRAGWGSVASGTACGEAGSDPCPDHGRTGAAMPEKSTRGGRYPRPEVRWARATIPPQPRRKPAGAALYP